jgi:hypothetical protein
MKKLLPLILFSVIVFMSCKKEEFPDIDDLTGSWIEQTNQSFKHRLIFEKETLYFIKSTHTDTFSFHLDKKQEVIYLSSQAGESNHKILLNKKEKVLTIWGLFPSIPEKVSETKFKKE